MILKIFEFSFGIYFTKVQKNHIKKVKFTLINLKYSFMRSPFNIENIEELHSISLKPYELNHLEHFLMFWRFYIS